MKRHFGGLMCGVAILACVAAGAQDIAPRGVSEDNRYLVKADGTPFFYLGDTAWELFHRLNREEADLYIENRAAKGFTVIQAVALAELDGLHTPNPYGHTPLVDDDPARPDTKPGPNNDYWDHVDYIVNKANEAGLVIGMLPTWGDKWNKKWGVGPVVFTPENAEAYGEWLGERYGQKEVIWIVGGDRPIENDTHRAIINAMAKGIERGDGGRNLMTYHPSGQSSSSRYVHEEEWLDFNMSQSGHERPGKPNYRIVLDDLAREPAKPALDGEPCYEDHPVKGDTWNKRHEPGVLLDWFDEWDVRVPAYQAMLSGAFGHTYGNHNIWQMWVLGRPAISVARTPWYLAMDHPGAQQMLYFRKLFEARPFWKMQPMQELVRGDNPEGPDHVRAARAVNGAYAVLYIPRGKTVDVETRRIAGARFKAFWFNPRQNSAQLIGEFPRTDTKTFTPPTVGRNNDWVLVLDDASADLTPIGYSYQNITPAVAE